MKAACICSVKGGVGKTLVSLNIAYMLKEMGHKVGLIDADWDNPNFAQFTNIDANIESDSKSFTPYTWKGIQVFSMSLIAGRGKSISLTGDRYLQLMYDVVHSTKWDCDIFIVDMPSGSGDAFKSAITVLGDNLVGDIMVIQPSMRDASQRALNLHKFYEIPVLGLIENMSYFKCVNHPEPLIYYPFGKSIVDKLAEEYNVEVLGKIPLIPDMPERINNGNPIFDDEESKMTIENACKKIIESKPVKVGFVERFKTKLLEGVKEAIEKVLAYFIITVNREIPIAELKAKTGFTEEKPFLLRIVDESGTKEITKVALRIKGDRLIVVKNPEKVDFEIRGSFRTIARMIMGKRKLSDGSVAPYDPIDAWLNGEIYTNGMGYAPKAVHAIRTIFQTEDLMNQIREKYGSILEKWI